MSIKFVFIPSDEPPAEEEWEIEEEVYHDGD